MKYVTAILASIFIFLGVSFLAGLILLSVIPPAWTQVGVQIGLLRANIASLISIIFGGIVATYTFRASLSSKTGRLYRKKKK